MSLDAAGISAFVQQNRTALGLGGALVVAGLAYRARKGGAATPGAAATARPAGTIPAAAVTAGSTPATGGGTYDSSAYDVYAALQSELSPFLQGQAAQTGTSGAPTDVPSVPIASQLIAPNYTGNYWQMGSGIGEIESDGSLFVYNPAQWGEAQQRNPGILANVGGPGLDWYSTGSNVAHTVAGSTKTPPPTS